MVFCFHPQNTRVCARFSLRFALTAFAPAPAWFYRGYLAHLKTPARGVFVSLGQVPESTKTGFGNCVSYFKVPISGKRNRNLALIMLE
jgi:hypothetical protein